MTNIADFQVEKEKCIGCGLCAKVCPGGILHLNEERKCEMDEIDQFGWWGCWKCEHCLAVCPRGAISIFGRQPEDSLPPVKAESVALVIYNQYLLLRNFLAGLDGVDRGGVEAAAGMGMTHLQLLWKVQLPLAKKALIAGLRIALVSTVGIATIAASINAGGLGTILFDGLRTMNTAKILWGSLLSAALAVAIDRLLLLVERKS